MCLWETLAAKFLDTSRGGTNGESPCWIRYVHVSCNEGRVGFTDANLQNSSMFSIVFEGLGICRFSELSSPWKLCIHTEKAAVNME